VSRQLYTLSYNIGGAILLRNLFKPMKDINSLDTYSKICLLAFTASVPEGRFKIPVSSFDDLNISPARFLTKSILYVLEADGWIEITGEDLVLNYKNDDQFLVELMSGLEPSCETELMAIRDLAHQLLVAECIEFLAAICGASLEDSAKKGEPPNLLFELTETWSLSLVHQFLWRATKEIENCRLTRLSSSGQNYLIQVSEKAKEKSEDFIESKFKTINFKRSLSFSRSKLAVVLYTMINPLSDRDVFTGAPLEGFKSMKVKMSEAME